MMSIARMMLMALWVICVGCGAAAVRELSPSALAGEWRGRVSTPLSHTVATMVITADGRYDGVMYFDGEDRPFHGALVRVRPGRLGYVGQGDGTIVVERIADDIVLLKFTGYDGGWKATFQRER